MFYLIFETVDLLIQMVSLSTTKVDHLSYNI